MGRPKKLIVKKIFSDEEISKREGHWMEESDIKYPIIESNTDVYYKDDNGELRLLLKFRKNCIDDKKYNKSNPFKFMETIGMIGKTNFFEARPTDYQDANIFNNTKDEFEIDNDF